MYVICIDINGFANLDLLMDYENKIEYYLAFILKAFYMHTVHCSVLPLYCNCNLLYSLNFECKNHSKISYKKILRYSNRTVSFCSKLHTVYCIDTLMC